ncbi:MAG: HEAT repeat domain-containing protein [Pirellulaceae bacterium]
MDDRLKTLLADISRVNELPPAERGRCLKRSGWLAEAEPPDQAEFAAALLKQNVPLDEPADELLRAVLGKLVALRRTAAGRASSELKGALVQLYRHLGPPSRARAQVLAWLALGGSESELQQLAELLVEDPPREEEDVLLAFTPLFQNPKLSVAALFPRLLAAIAHPLLAAGVLDLANFVVRQKLVNEHPAAGISSQLSELLGELVGTLGKLTEQAPSEEQSMAEIGRQVSQSVSLAVSLCDALALIGDKEAIGKLYQALDLGHRRLRTEAAAALARLGEDHGKEELLKLAAESVARLRVLAYAKELGLTERVPPELRTPVARAEAELTVWLAEPTQFGLPPTKCELFDQRTQFWPGFSKAVECFLFRFTYELTLDEAARTYSNIGIAGPLAHAFTADLADLSPDDIYAAFAGWQAQHEDIREFDVARLSKSELMEVVRLERRLHDAGYRDVQSLQMGYFFGEKALIAQAAREEIPGIAIADFSDITFFPIRNVRKALGPREAYSVYKGRKLLKTFNRGSG